MDTGTFVDTNEAASNTLRDIVERYICEVLPTMRGHRQDEIRLAAHFLQLRDTLRLSASPIYIVLARNSG